MGGNLYINLWLYFSSHIICKILELSGTNPCIFATHSAVEATRSFMRCPHWWIWDEKGSFRSSSLAAYFLLFTQSVSLVHCSVFINQVRPSVHTHSHENCTIFAMKFKWENIGEGQKRGSTDDFGLNYPAVLLHLNFLSKGWSWGGRPEGDDELLAY